MKIVNILIIAIIVLLSIAAGLAKVMQAPQEMDFLQGVGLSSAMIIAFGLVQTSAGVLLVPQKISRRWLSSGSDASLNQQGRQFFVAFA